MVISGQVVVELREKLTAEDNEHRKTLAREENLRAVLGNQHYYESDCSGCADNMKYADEVLK